MTRQELMALASLAGFGGQLRNTHAVKLEVYARLVIDVLEARIAGLEARIESMNQKANEE